MKKNSNVLNYVEKYKNKYGIKYAESDGKLVNALSVIYYIVFAYTVLMTALFVLGISLTTDFANIKSDALNSFITICGATVIMIAGLVLYICRKKVLGCIFTFCTQPFALLAFWHITRDTSGFVNTSFYWRHGVPAAILFVLAVLIFAILIRAKFKTDKLYQKLLNALYSQYGTKDGEKLTDEQWQQFLNDYNPYKPQF